MGEKNQFSERGYRVKSLFKDKGTAYINSEVTDILSEAGIESHTTNEYTPASNGMSKHLNQTLLSDARTISHSGKLESKFWPEAILYVTTIRHHVYNTKLKTSAAKLIGLEPLDSRRLSIFGEIVSVHIPPNEGKLETRSHTGIYLGHDEQTYGVTTFIPVPLMRKGFFEYTRHVRLFRQSILYPDYINLKSSGGKLDNIAFENDNQYDFSVEDHNEINSRG